MAKAKSASPSWKPESRARGRACARRAAGCSPPCSAGTTALRKPASPSAATRARQAASTSSCGRLGKRRIRPARQLLGEAAVTVLEERPARGFGERASQLPSNTGFCFAAKARKARAKSSVSMHSACATASASIACLDRHRPFHLQHALGHGIGEGRAVGEFARERVRFRQHASGAASRLKKPQRSASSPPSTRPV